MGGVITYTATRKAVFSNMVLIDNAVSAEVLVGSEGDNLAAEMNNMLIYGESESRDCKF
jgi:hypothetical protein